MRKYRAEEIEKLEKVICNGCGRELKIKNGYLKEGCFSARHGFGYFSRRDGLQHSFDLCEDCYEKWIGSFVIPVEEEEIKELL